MVVKTELCTFSEYKIYPGKGIRYVAKDGRPFLFLAKRTRTFALKYLVSNLGKLKPKDWDGPPPGEDSIKKLNKLTPVKLKEEEMIKESKREPLKVLPLMLSINLRTQNPKTKKLWQKKLLDKSRKERKLKLPKSKETKKQ